MTDSYPFYVYSGLLTKEHRKNIGSALWEFLWCIDKTTTEVDEIIQDKVERVGLVLGGKPINLLDIANELGGSKSTVFRNIEKLENEGYLTIIRAPYGLVIKVRNSKKWISRTVPKTEREPNKWKETVLKTERALQKRNERSKNDNSNKDKAIDKPNDLVVVDNAREETHGMPSPLDAAPVEPDADSGRVSTQQYQAHIKNKYLQRRGKGLDLSTKDYDALDEIIQNKIPLRVVLEGIDKAFDEYKPEHSRDEIRSLNYCVPIVFDLYARKQREAMQSAADVGYIDRDPKESGTDEGYYAGIGRRVSQWD